MTGSSGRHTKPTVTRICCVTCQPFGALSRSTVATLYYKLSRAPTAILRSANERMKPVADPEIWNKWGGRRGCRVWGKFLFFCAKIVHFRAKFSPVLRCIRSIGGGAVPLLPPALESATDWSRHTNGAAAAASGDVYVVAYKSVRGARSWNFPTEEILSAHNLNFAHKCSQKRDFQSQISYFLEENFSRGKI